MSDDLVFGVALKSTGDGSVTANVKSAREEMDKLKQSTDEMAAAASKAAAGYDNDFGAMQKRLNEFAIAEDNARDKAWALANGYKDVGGSMVKTVEEVAASHHVNSLAIRESLVLMREAAAGNWSRMAGSATLLAQSLGGVSLLMNPIVLGVAGVAAAVAGGIYWWDKYGESIEDIHAKLNSVADDGLQKLTDKIYLQNQTLENRLKANSQTGLTGLSDAEVNRLGVLNLQMEVYSTRLAHAKTGTDEYAESTRGLAKAQEGYNKLVQELADRQSLQQQSKDLGKDGKADTKLLADSQRLDAQMAESHKDAFDRTIDQWVAMQEKMTAAGIYYGKVREDHEAAYTAYVNAENLKRNTQAEDAAKKKSDAEAKHLAAQITSENAYFAQVAAATAKSEKDSTATENKRFAEQMVIWQKRRDQAAADHALSTEEENSFNMAKTAMAEQHAEIINQINKQSMLADLQTLGEKSRVFFEISKQAAVAEIVMHGGERAEKAAAWAATWGGPIAAAAAEALSWAATAINVAKVESTQFGGGANVSSSGGSASFSAPSNTPSTPVSVTPPPSAKAAQATQQLNITIIGAKDNPDKAVLSFNALVDIVAGINKVGQNGYRINASVISA